MPLGARTLVAGLDKLPGIPGFSKSLFNKDSGAAFDFLANRTLFNPDQSGLARHTGFRNWMKNQQGGLDDLYTADVGASGDDKLSFLDWLAKRIDDDSFGQQFGALAPSQRGENPERYAPRLQFLNRF